MDNKVTYKKRLTYLIVFIALIVILAVTLTFVYSKVHQKNDRVEFIDNKSDQEIYIAEEKLKINDFKVEYQKDGYWYLSLYVENVSSDYYDVGEDYRIIIYSVDGNIITEYKSSILGNLEAGKKVECQFRDVYTGVLIGSVEIKKVES